MTSLNMSACLWVNERTGDYVAAWSYQQHYLFSYKKSDDTWRNLEVKRCRSMAYKNDKLYVFTGDKYIKIFDFSGDSVNEIVEGNPYRNHRFQYRPGENVWKSKVAVENSGEVLIAVNLRGRFIHISKMNYESGKWERVDSLGGEMLMLGHGVTVRSPIKEIPSEGIKSYSVCFIDHDFWPGQYNFRTQRKIKSGIYDLATRKITWPKPLADSFLKSFWFVPGYA